MANYRAAARRAAQRYGLNPNVFVRQINQESGFDPGAVSPAGATGIAQIMPATARGWGVNPRDPIASLDAAAKNMARYVKQFGSYEKALRAYNAGPGNVERSRGFSETNNYVRSILGGRSPSARGVGRGTGGGGGVGVRTPEGLRFSPAQQTANAVALLSSLREPEQAARPEVTLPSAPAFSATAPLPRGFQAPETSGAPVRQRLDVTGALEALKGLSEGGIPSATYGGRTVQIPGGRGGGRAAPGSRRRSHLKEEFYNGPGGVNVDEGRRVGKGFVSGHTDHVHVATSTPREAVQLGKLAQRMGLHVGEHPRFGGVDPVHAKGSFHYRRRAVDVSGSPRQMRRYSRRVAQIYGV